MTGLRLSPTDRSLTNVLVYAAQGTDKDEPKRVRALEVIESEDFGTWPGDQQLVRIAIERSQRYAISCWDAAILAAAEALGAHTVYSEDLNAGQRYGRVRVVNPFS